MGKLQHNNRDNTEGSTPNKDNNYNHRKNNNKTVYCKTGHQILKSTLSPGFRRQRRGSYAREEGKANTGQDSADEVKHTEAGASQVKSRYPATRPESVSSIGKHLEIM